jgi:hypothetical protein
MHPSPLLAEHEQRKEKKDLMSFIKAKSLPSIENAGNILYLIFEHHLYNPRFGSFNH